ncbi:MAG: dihydrodipicolinate synthase family protein [Fulvivirga sp.]
MQPLSSNEIYGNWATLLLPIKKNESIDWKLLEVEIDLLIDYKVNGIYSNGTAGEFYNITEDEFDKVSLILAEKCNGAGMPFQVGVSHMSPVISLNRLKRTLPLKPSAVQVILPDWFGVTDAEAVDFLQKMSETAGEIGLVLYNPPHAKRNLEPEDFKRFQQKIANLVGIKVAGGDEKWYADMKQLCPDMSVFIPGHHLASGCLKGAHGAYSNMACLNPLAAQKWYRSVVEGTDGALELEERINAFLSEYIIPFITKKHYSNQAVDKCLAAIGGWSDMGTRLRWPYKSIDEETAISLRPVAKNIIPEFF